MRLFLLLVFMATTAGLTVIVARATEDDLAVPEETSQTLILPNGVRIEGGGGISVEGSGGSGFEGGLGEGGQSSGGVSMFERDNLRRALGVLRSQAGEGRAATIRVDEEAVLAVVANGAGGRAVIVSAGGNATTTTDVPTTGPANIRLSEVRPDVPERLLGALQRSNARENVDHMIVEESSDGGLEWRVSLEGGTGFRADARGHPLTQVPGP